MVGKRDKTPQISIFDTAVPARLNRVKKWQKKKIK